MSADGAQPVLEGGLETWGRHRASENFDHGDQFAKCVPHWEARSRDARAALDVTGVAQTQRPAGVWTTAAACR